MREAVRTNRASTLVTAVERTTPDGRVAIRAEHNDIARLAVREQLRHVRIVRAPLGLRGRRDGSVGGAKQDAQLLLPSQRITDE